MLNLHGLIVASRREDNHLWVDVMEYSRKEDICSIRDYGIGDEVFLLNNASSLKIDHSFNHSLTEPLVYRIDGRACYITASNEYRYPWEVIGNFLEPEIAVFITNIDPATYHIWGMQELFNFYNMLDQFRHKQNNHLVFQTLCEELLYKLHSTAVV